MPLYLSAIFETLLKLDGPVVNNLPASAGDARDMDLILAQKDPWSKKRQSTPVFLPGKFHGQRSLAGYSPWGHKELHTHTQALKH